ncbi:hypothetical protein DV515_00017368 [Chloebia gouldiae]|uniref:Uncharacterized protein n=1 Tax=Chloebia gouldiae TaxID=44316 RepID=A0A3L8QW79_CHLGU|nr:hypothetical protein DV515_00017368 [Chloebia gouldiae]
MVLALRDWVTWHALRSSDSRNSSSARAGTLRTARSTGGTPGTQVSPPSTPQRGQTPVSQVGAPGGAEPCMAGEPRVRSQVSKAGSQVCRAGSQGAQVRQGGVPGWGPGAPEDTDDDGHGGRHLADLLIRLHDLLDPRLPQSPALT